MSEQPLGDVFPALGIAAFERTPDGAFLAAAPVPPWFNRLVGDVTFPFLGHILEEAVDFWNEGTAGYRDYGPCAEVDDAGHEYHYKVTAVVAAGRQYLLFQLDPASDHLRDVLQQARDRALEARADARVELALGAVQRDVRRTGDEVLDLMRRLLASGPTPVQLDLLHTLSRTSADLVERVDAIVKAASPSTR